MEEEETKTMAAQDQEYDQILRAWLKENDISMLDAVGCLMNGTCLLLKYLLENKKINDFEQFAKDYPKDYILGTRMCTLFSKYASENVKK